MMHAMRGMVAEFMRDNGRSESDSAEGGAAVEKSPRGAGTTAVRYTSSVAVSVARDTTEGHETIFCEDPLRNFGATGRRRALFLSRLVQPGVSQTSLGGLAYGMYAQAESWVVVLICLSRDI